MTPSDSHSGRFAGSPVYLVIEYAALFILLPLVVGVLPLILERTPWFTDESVKIPVLPVLWVITVACLMVLLRDPSFQRGRLWQIGSPSRRDIYMISGRFILLAGVMTGLLIRYQPDLLFSLIRTRPLLWLMIMILYPLLSVYPQNIVYRAFIFHRYHGLIGKPWALIVLSTAGFAISHVVFRNWPAVAATLIGGYLFAATYMKTRSLLLASIEHSAYGCFIFTIGLGRYFYHGFAGEAF